MSANDRRALTMQPASMMPLEPRTPNALWSIDLGMTTGLEGQSHDGPRDRLGTPGTTSMDTFESAAADERRPLSEVSKAMV
jgi:hypothetical protein